MRLAEAIAFPVRLLTPIIDASADAVDLLLANAINTADGEQQMQLIELRSRLSLTRQQAQALIDELQGQG